MCCGEDGRCVESKDSRAEIDEENRNTRVLNRPRGLSLKGFLAFAAICHPGRATVRARSEKSTRVGSGVAGGFSARSVRFAADGRGGAFGVFLHAGGQCLHGVTAADSLADTGCADARGAGWCTRGRALNLTDRPRVVPPPFEGKSSVHIGDVTHSLLREHPILPHHRTIYCAGGRTCWPGVESGAPRRTTRCRRQGRRSALLCRRQGKTFVVRSPVRSVGRGVSGPDFSR